MSASESFGRMASAQGGTKHIFGVGPGRLCLGNRRCTRTDEVRMRPRNSSVPLGRPCKASGSGATSDTKVSTSRAETDLRCPSQYTARREGGLARSFLQSLRAAPIPASGGVYPHRKRASVRLPAGGSSLRHGGIRTSRGFSGGINPPARCDSGCGRRDEHIGGRRRAVAARGLGFREVPWDRRRRSGSIDLARRSMPQ